MVSISKQEIHHNATRVSPWELKGYIWVSPPKGKCIRIQARKDRSDIDICEGQLVSFTMEDLDLDGRLTWKVFRTREDFGTDVTWPSPYLVGKGVVWGNDFPGPSHPIMIESCKVINKQESRRVHIRLLNQKQWTVTFPKEDVLVHQPMKNPNLYYVNTEGGVKKTSADMQEEGKERESGSGIKLQIGQLVKKTTYKWQGFHRYAYEMESSHFHSVASNPPGMNGVCRYKTKSWKTRPDIGLIECHNTDQFRWIYLPLRCMRGLEIREKPLK